MRFFWTIRCIPQRSEGSPNRVLSIQRMMYFETNGPQAKYPDGGPILLDGNSGLPPSSPGSAPLCGPPAIPKAVHSDLVRGGISRRFQPNRRASTDQTPGPSNANAAPSVAIMIQNQAPPVAAI